MSAQKRWKLVLIGDGARSQEVPAGKAGQVEPSLWRPASGTIYLSGDELDAALRARLPEPSS